MKSKKYAYLRLDHYKKNDKKELIHFKDPFWIYMKEGQLAFSTSTFLVASALCGIMFYLIYAATTKSQIISLLAGVLSAFIPYLYYKVPALLKIRVDDALATKNFISILQSSLRMTNSTREALLAVGEEKSLSKKYKKLLEGMASDIKLGDSIEGVIDNAVAKSNDSYFKVAMTIVKINHKIGSAFTIDALNNIQKSMDLVINNVQMLKDKVNSSLISKGIFLAILMIAPIYESVNMPEISLSFYESGIGTMIMVFVFLFAYAGQFIMCRVSEKAIKGI